MPYTQTEVAMHEAIKLLSQHGIITDPIYTGKAFAGLIDLIEKKPFTRNENVVFVHTGGTAFCLLIQKCFIFSELDPS